MSAIELVKRLLESDAIDWSQEPDEVDAAVHTPQKLFYVKSHFDGDTTTWSVYNNDNTLYRNCWSFDEAEQAIHDAGGRLITPSQFEAQEDIDWSQEPGDLDAPTSATVAKYSGTQLFDEGAMDILDDARRLYVKLQKDGTLAAVENSGVDQSSIAQALLKIAIESRGSRGGEKAYKLFRRHGRFVI